MKFLDKLKVGWNDIINRKGRSILTALSISIGVILLIFFLGIGDTCINKIKEMNNYEDKANIITVIPYETSDSLEEKQASESEDGENRRNKLVEINSDNSFESDEKIKVIDKRTLNDFLKIDNIDKISAFIQTRINEIKVENKDLKSNIQVLGYDMEYKTNYDKDIIYGSNIEDRNQDIVITRDIAIGLGYKNVEDILDKKINLSLDVDIKDIKSIELLGTVKGVVDSKLYSSSVFMSDVKAETILNKINNTNDYIANEGYSQVEIYPKDKENISSIADEIQNKYNYEATYFNEDGSEFKLIVFIIKGLLSIGGIIVIIVSGCGLINTITMILQEKKKMIGVMRSVGGSKKQIRSIFRYQAIIIGLIGAIGGSILAVILIEIANKLVLCDKGFEIIFNFNNILISIVIAFLISYIAGTFPAIKAAKLNVVDAVKEE